MKTAINVLLILLLTKSALFESKVRSRNEDEAIAFLRKYNDTAGDMLKAHTQSNWNYYSNITDYSERKMVESKSAYALFEQESSRQASEFDRSGFHPDVVRRLEFLIYIGDGLLEGEDQTDLNNIVVSMKSRYAKGNVCTKTNGCYSHSEMNDYLANSTNYNEKYLLWKGWRDSVAAPARQDYQSYVDLKNKAAKANDQADWGAFWRSQYEEDDFKGLVESLWKQIAPYYQQMHAYVRRKLYQRYGADGYINLRGPIPAHLLGNMWAMNWNKLYEICQPFPEKSSIDITPILQKKGYTALQMFQKTEEYFVSLGLDEMTGSFWHSSILEKPDKRDIVCHSTAWDFRTDDDFRMIKCTYITQSSFVSLHHGMGHIEYFMQYKDQPMVYRKPANPAFFEASADVLSLSLLTPQHLYHVGLLDELAIDDEADLNFLMKMALEQVALLPFALTLDEWRWGVFDGTIPVNSWNEDWWKLRLKYQGLVPPSERTEDDFDPASIAHVPSDHTYINYFVGHVLQFHMLKSLCSSSGHQGPLHRCDLFKSLQTGTKLRSAWSLGGSKRWEDAFEIITGVREIDAAPMIEYFQPIFDYIAKVNEENGDVVGWPDTAWIPKEPQESVSSRVIRLYEIVAILAGVVLISLIGWFVYAYTHPNSRAGHCLILMGGKCRSRKYDATLSSTEDSMINRTV